MSKDNNTQTVKESDQAKARVDKYRSGKISYREYLHDLHNEWYGSYDAVTPTKPTDKTNTCDIKFLRTKSVKVYLRPSMKTKSLGRYTYTVDRRTNEVIRDHISINLKQVVSSCIHMYPQDESITFADMFSHVVSHEYIHRAIRQVEGMKACHELDHKHGQIIYDDQHTYGNGLVEAKK